MSFQEFGLDKRLLGAIEDLGFHQPTAIQQQAIPAVMTGKDLMASSQTGSGKTLAFLLPILQRLLRQKAYTKRDARALLLAPTRELAFQVAADFRAAASKTQIKAALIVGGENFIDQAKTLRRDPQVIIATPGRLVEHLDQNHLGLNGLEVLVLDEADRMLDLGFADDLRKIGEQADHRKRQTLLFSATLDDEEIANLSIDLLNEATRIEIGSSIDQHQDISQQLYLADHLDHKEALLDALLQQADYNQALVFTATKADTERLATLLKSKGHNAGALSGDLAQAARNKVVDEFKRGQIKLLVATDVAARGLDIRNVSHVVNFDLPKHPEDYIHRIGRTGRAGASGTALSLVSKKDWPSLVRIQLFLKREFSFEVIPGLEAKFKGVKPKAPKAKASRKPVKAKGAAPVDAGHKPVRKPRNKAFLQGVDAGMAPVRKKKPQNDD